MQISVVWKLPYAVCYCICLGELGGVNLFLLKR
ncbi:hypothetical protein T4A_321 [Trichinella pseudospiralis]|uniref:Uncharacterized protein n=1 Tax=Trichinella pseudospiralis TaxID=6337 RepID=A0A0V1DN05_TRIPS|nr:hypothetical protein T4A_321 [Trichinella pseudospiralis]